MRVFCMSKDNELFIRYFDYYKKHPNKFKTMKDGLLPKIIVTFGISFCLLAFTVSQLSTFSENVYLLSYLLFFGTLSMFGVALYIEGSNSRYAMFCNMTYIGSAADLFGDLKAPELKPHLNVLVDDFNDYSGIKGDTAYNIYSTIKNDEDKKIKMESKAYKKELEQERITKEIITNSVQEIKIIQKEI